MNDRTIEERIILSFARQPEEVSGLGATANYTVDKALDYARKTIPGLTPLLRVSAYSITAADRDERPERLEDIPGGLNRMTIRRFEKSVYRCAMSVEKVSLFSTWGLPMVTKIPAIRELFTSAASCILRRS